MFNEIEMVESYLNGENIPVRALDDCIFQISKYYKEKGINKIDAKKNILKWLEENNLYFIDINNNIDNAYNTKSKLIGKFKVFINKDDINAINFAADFPTSKKIALFLTIYAKLHADESGTFKIRIATFSQWIGVRRENLYSRYLSQLAEYGFIEIVDNNTYSKYLNKKHEEKRMSIKINHKLVNNGDFFIENNKDFIDVFNRIFM